MNEEKESLTKRDGEEDKKKKKKKKHKKRKNTDSDDDSEENKKSAINDDTFKILNRYNLIKMLGSGSFGEIHLAIDSNDNELRAIKFELSTIKNPQLKHENNIIDQLNKIDNNSNIPTEGIPKVYGFDRIEGKCNFMVMDFLGPTLSDLFQFKAKQFSLQTVILIGLQMLQRIEFVHEKGFIHRDIKPENFLIGLEEKSNIIHIIDFGLSKRYKEKSSGQHIAYRENRNLVGTARYASINAHLGIEQSRRDDIESIGFVLVYFLIGRLPWQSKNDKGKYPNKIMEKKLITPPEILCKKLPMEFAYYFHYCKNLKFEDRPDYTALKALFFDVLLRETPIPKNNEYTFDWFEDQQKDEYEKDQEIGNNALSYKKQFGDNNVLDEKDEDDNTPMPDLDNKDLTPLKDKKHLQGTFSFNEIIKDKAVQKKKTPEELDKIEGDDSDSDEGMFEEENPRLKDEEDVKITKPNKSFNSRKASDDDSDEDKKTVKLSETNRSAGQDEIVRNIINNDKKINEFNLLPKGSSSEREKNSSSELSNRKPQDDKIYVKESPKKGGKAELEDIILEINK